MLHWSHYHAMPEVPGGYYGIWNCFYQRWHVRPTLTPSEAFALEENLNREAS